VSPATTEVTVNSRKFDGSIRRTWKAKLLCYDPPLIKLRGEFDSDVEHADLGTLKRGTISYEFYWLDRWHNIFCFFEPSGEFRNYYLNVSMPPTFSEGVVDYIDLDVDVVVWPDGRVVVLDEADLRASAKEFGYLDELIAKVGREVESLVAMARTNQLPRLDP
jgi:protein associated with RNAse G/E